jgi:hypothetical protein
MLDRIKSTFSRLTRRASPPPTFETVTEVREARKRFLGAMALVAGAGFVSPAQAIGLPPKLLTGQLYNINNFFIPGDTDFTNAFTRAIARAGAAGGGSIYFPAAATPYVVSSSAISISQPNITVRGDGPGASIIQAAASAALTQIISTTSTGINFTLRDITLDGNRANGGLYTVSGSYGLILTANIQRVINVEIKNCVRIACAIGSSVSVPFNFLFDGCYIHDNGGLTAGGIGVGIFGFSAYPPQDVKIVNSHFENNYNTVTGPGDSTAINLIGSRVLIASNFFKNNYNVNGGQVVVSDGIDGAHGMFATITNNIIEQSGSFGGDLTCGFEIEGCDFTIVGNIVINVAVDAIRLEGASAYGTITGNQLTCLAGACVNCINTSGNQVTISGNALTQGAYGVSLQSSQNLSLVGNTFGSGLTATVAGASNITGVVSGNLGYSLVKTFTGATTGWTTNLAPTMRYQINNGIVTLELDTFLSGTSNATTKTITGLPAEAAPSGPRSFLCGVSNNGAAIWTAGVVTIVGSTIQLGSDPGGAAWTASGSAGVQRFSGSYTL